MSKQQGDTGVVQMSRVYMPPPIPQQPLCAARNDGLTTNTHTNAILSYTGNKIMLAGQIRVCGCILFCSPKEEDRCVCQCRRRIRHRRKKLKKLRQKRKKKRRDKKHVKKHKKQQVVCHDERLFVGRGENVESDLSFHQGNINEVQQLWRKKQRRHRHRRQDHPENCSKGVEHREQSNTNQVRADPRSAASSDDMSRNSDRTWIRGSDSSGISGGGLTSARIRWKRHLRVKLFDVVKDVRFFHIFHK